MVNSSRALPDVLTEIEERIQQEINTKSGTLLTKEQPSYEDYLRLFHSMHGARKALGIVQSKRKELAL